MAALEVSLVTALATPAVKALIELLSKRQRKVLAKEAHLIVTVEPDSQARVRSLFSAAQNRLRATWVMAMAMTVTLFVLVVGMAITAVITGVLLKTSTYPVVFGGLSGTSLLTIVMWKPYDKAFHATITTQRLELVMLALEQAWAGAAVLSDAQERANAVRTATEAALTQMERLAV